MRDEPLCDGSRRAFLRGTLAVGGAAALFGPIPARARAWASRIRVGLMLPYSGEAAPIGIAIENGFRLAIRENAARVAGREIEYVRVDDESLPENATGNAARLVSDDRVDVLVGSVHSGVQLGMVAVARETGVLHIIPGAGLDAASGPLCASNIFRTSFANSQISYPMGGLLADRRVRRVATVARRSLAGEESVAGFKAAFAERGGSILEELWLPHVDVEVQPLLESIGALRPDAVFAHFTGRSAVAFLRGYHAAGLKRRIPLFGSGFLTEGILEAAGEAAEGVETTLHYADGLQSAKNKAFRLSYARTYKLQPNVFAVQGYDAGLLLVAGVRAVKGDIGDRKAMIAAMERTAIDSPRGQWTVSRAHNPVQDFYLRRVSASENRVTGIAAKALDYPPASLCVKGS